MFVALPTGFPNLMAASAAMGRWGLGSPPDMTGLGLRLQRIFLRTPHSEWDSISNSDWKNLPYAFWLDGKETFVEHPEILAHYFNVKLADAAREPRRLKRWVKPLVFVYAAEFNATNALINRIASQVCTWLAQPATLAGSPLHLLNTQLSFFNPQRVGHQLALAILDHPESHSVGNAWLGSIGLWPSFMNTQIVTHAFKTLVSSTPAYFGNESFSYSLIAWAFHAKTYREQAPLWQFTNALLMPWQASEPSKALRERILKLYCDELSNENPRMHRGHWDEVDAKAKTLIMRWMTGESLELFFRILRESAESMWEHRERFWGALFKHGVIDEAWPVLGKEAVRLATRMALSSREFATLRGAQGNQSVLLMRMGDFVFAEWTHSGSLRVATIESGEPPRFYSSQYTAEKLRFISEPFEFFGGLDGLRHTGSDEGNWQRRALSFMRIRMGIHLKESEYR